jgi:hypothetical protein
MQRVQELLERACSLSRRASLEFLRAVGTNDARLASKAGKHMAAATTDLTQVRQELEAAQG